MRDWELWKRFWRWTGVGLEFGIILPARIQVWFFTRYMYGEESIWSAVCCRHIRVFSQAWLKAGLNLRTVEAFLEMNWAGFRVWSHSSSQIASPAIHYTSEQASRELEKAQSKWSIRFETDPSVNLASWQSAHWGKPLRIINFPSEIHETVPYYWNFEPETSEENSEAKRSAS